MELISEARSKVIVHMRSVVEARKEQDGLTAPAPIEVMQLDAIGGNETRLRRARIRGQRRSWCPRSADAEHRQNHGSVSHDATLIRPNEYSAKFRCFSRKTFV
jgi:hypothetical protein